MSEPTEFRHLVRISGRDLDGGKKLIAALSDLKGVGYNFANVITSKLSLDPRVRLGTLSEEQVKEIESVIQSTSKAALPKWFYNRRNDPETGEARQLLGSDLDFIQKNDIEDEKNIQSWKGVRHGLGLKVRGQRTRTTGRKGRTVGVRKATLVAAAKEAAAKKEEK
jgi:small subunit ribosomal protein S13